MVEWNHCWHLMSLLLYHRQILLIPPTAVAGVDRNEVVVGFRIVMSFKLWFYECVLGSGDFRYELHSSGRPGL